jgi:hypothetical protein
MQGHVLAAVVDLWSTWICDESIFVEGVQRLTAGSTKSVPTILSFPVRLTSTGMTHRSLTWCTSIQSMSRRQTRSPAEDQVHILEAVCHCDPKVVCLSLSNFFLAAFVEWTHCCERCAGCHV